VFAWLVLIVCFAVLLMLGVNAILRRLGLTPSDADVDRRDGLASVAARLERWANERRHPPER
jgi:hypothetical protein